VCGDFVSSGGALLKSYKGFSNVLRNFDLIFCGLTQEYGWKVDGLQKIVFERFLHSLRIELPQQILLQCHPLNNDNETEREKKMC
jgi:hypothetical protein